MKIYPYLRGFFAGLGIVFFILILLVIFLVMQFMHGDKNDKPEKLPDNMTLTFTLSQPMVEYVPALVRHLAGASAPPSLEEWIATLGMAAFDPHVKAIYIRAVGGTISLTQVEELRQTIARVRAAGKKVVFFTDTFGEMENGTGMYYLAAACNQIVLQPGGFVGFSGVGIEEPFLRAGLEKYGILPEFEKRRAYKSAMDMLTEKSITPADQQQLTRLVGHLAGHIAEAVSADRGISLDDLNYLRDQSPIAANDAMQLVDNVQYEDQIKFPGKRVEWTDYITHLDPSKTTDDGKTPHIVVLNVAGEITRGEGGGRSLFADSTVGAEDFTQTLDDIQKNKDISAVVIRLNSPGGSAIASESMNRAVEHLKDSGKPVIVSMGEVAASGGYYLAAAASRILAEPSTLTGSIGVIVGKISLGGLSSQLGVHWDEITVGKDAALFATGRGFNPDERAAVARSADIVYETFKTRVAAGRKLKPDVVEQLAQGQVWTGAEARQNGLVDQLGGLIEAVVAAKQELKLAPDAKVVVEPYPDQDNPGELLQLLLHQVGVIDRTQLMNMLRENLSSMLHLHTAEMAPLKLIN